LQIIGYKKHPNHMAAFYSECDYFISLFDTQQLILIKGGTKMAIRIVQLGSPREKDEGLRVGTVRRPPRGVPKTDCARKNFYDVWLPNISPSPELMKEGKSAQDDRSWASFSRKFRAEMKKPEAGRILDLLAALSHQAQLSVGCYCEDEKRCHRSILRELLEERGAELK
jgi:uncharacterized protein YeaO (DUF488 family)